MSTKRKAKPVINPLAALELHQKVGQADTDAIALPLLIHLDMAHRGLGNTATADFLFQHLATAQILSSRAGNRPIYDMSVEAVNALVKAIARPTSTLSFTTGEYQAIRKCISVYLRVLPNATVKAVAYAGHRAVAVLQEMVREAA